MPENATAAATRTGAEKTEYARRRARFTYLLRRARATVEGEPRLTPDELRQLAGVYGEAAGDRAASGIRLSSPCQSCGQPCEFPGDGRPHACDACGEPWSWPGFDLPALPAAPDEQAAAA